MNDKKWLLAIVFCALVIRLGFAIYSERSGVIREFKDDLAYMDFAKNVLSQGPAVPHIERFKNSTSENLGPGLPWYMAVVMGIFGKKWLPIFIFNALLGAAICLITFYTGKILFNSRVGLFAAGWSMIYAMFINFTPTAGKEILLTLLFSLILLLLAKASQPESRGKKSYWILTSLVYAYLVHTDERYLAYLPLIMFFLFYLGQETRTTRIKKMLGFALLTLLCSIPWTVRNYIVYNKIVVISKRTSHLTDKLLGYKPEGKSPVDVADKWRLSENEIAAIVKGEKTTRANGKEINAEQVKAMRDGILPHAFSTLESYWSIVQILWKPIDFKRGYSTGGYRYDGAWSLKHNIAIGLTYGILLPFLIIGFYYLFKEKKRTAIFFLMILLYHTAIHVFFIPFTRNRYRIPIDGIIILAACWGAYRLYLKIKNRDRGKNENISI